jgi:transcription initiation factor TFIIB
MESRAEWRSFSFEENNKMRRTGSSASLAYHDMGLATIIGKTDRDSSGHQIDASMKSVIHRLRTWDFRTRTSSPTDRNLIQAFTELDKLKDKLSLSDAIIEKIAYIYRKAREKKMIRGRSIYSMLAAAIYLVCREMEAPRSLKDIAEIMNVRRKDVSRGYRLLLIELDIKVPLADPTKCIVKIANKVKASEKSKRRAIEIMNDLIKREISAGKLPMALAGTVLYISCLNNGENKTQKDIAEAAGVTDVTLRNRFNDLKSKLQLN